MRDLVAKREYQRRWCQLNRDKVREKNRRWYAQNRQQQRERMRRRHAAFRSAKLEARYGMSAGEYTAMLEQQHGLCAICGRPDSGHIRNGEMAPLYVDHDHETGAVRGLLCFRCNSGLGSFGENPGLLLAAADYVVRGRQVTTPERSVTLSSPIFVMDRAAEGW